jgi:hypothetical protein
MTQSAIEKAVRLLNRLQRSVQVWGDLTSLLTEEERAEGCNMDIAWP